MTSATMIRKYLETEIRLGKLKPGYLINEEELISKFKVSKTPVREALLFLKAQGIVDNISRSGFCVIKLSVQELLSIWELMAELEAVAARLACERMTDEEIDHLVKIHKESKSAALEGDYTAWSQSNYAFHLALYEGSRNRFLKEDLLKVRLRTAGYLKQSFQAIRKAQRSYEQHGEILRAIVSRDSHKAAEMMSNHISLASDAGELRELLLNMSEGLLG